MTKRNRISCISLKNHIITSHKLHYVKWLRFRDIIPYAHHVALSCSVVPRSLVILTWQLSHWNLTGVHGWYDSRLLALYWISWLHIDLFPPLVASNQLHRGLAGLCSCRDFVVAVVVILVLSNKIYILYTHKSDSVNSILWNHSHSSVSGSEVVYILPLQHQESEWLHSLSASSRQFPVASSELTEM
jgi:hypothetical protein